MLENPIDHVIDRLTTSCAYAHDYRSTDKHLGLVMTLLCSLLHSANGSAMRDMRGGTDRQTDGQSDGR